MEPIDWKNFGLHTLRLLPFFACVILYFSLVRDDSSVILSTCLQCAPIIGLMLFVLIKGTQCTKKFRYTNCILIGLAFSCIGNVLISIDLFPVGLGFFGVVHIIYMSGFDIEEDLLEKKSLISLILYVVAFSIYLEIFRTLDLALKIEIPFYLLLLCTMCMVGIVSAIERCTVFALLFVVGAVLFYTASLLISLSVFLYYHFLIFMPRFYIVATYYAAQFLIALSTLSDTKTVSVQLTAA